MFFFHFLVYARKGGLEEYKLALSLTDSLKEEEGRGRREEKMFKFLFVL